MTAPGIADAALSIDKFDFLIGISCVELLHGLGLMHKVFVPVNHRFLGGKNNPKKPKFGWGAISTYSLPNSLKMAFVPCLRHIANGCRLRKKHTIG